MSRTVKTTPWWARMAVSPTLSVEVHDHRDGICNLPEIDRGVTRLHPGECHFEPSARMLYGPDSGCGCWMCTDQPGRKRQARLVRRASQILCQRIERVMQAGEDPDGLY